MEYKNLTDEVRLTMLSELESDIAANRVYQCPRLTDEGQAAFPALLTEAIQSPDDAWLARELNRRGLFNATERRNTKRGVVVARVPSNAAEVLAEGEYNRYYLRGLCVHAIEREIPSLIVYRARYSENPRHESQRMIGTSVGTVALLDDLRTHIGVDAALGLPPGPNSGLSAKLP